MSGKPQEIGYLFDANDLEECAGQDCKALIYFGRKFGKSHPYNPDGSSHFDNCPNADQFRSNPKPKRGRTAKKQNGSTKSLHPKVANALAIAGDIDTEQRQRWRLRQRQFKGNKHIKWDKIALCRAKGTPAYYQLIKELERTGAPFQNGVPELAEPIRACIVSRSTEQTILGFVVKDWLYDRLYEDMYGNVTADRGEHLLMSVADFMIKPQSEVPERMWDVYLESL